MLRGRRSRLTAALAALALVLVSGAAASALAPGRSGLYGGGAVRDFLQFVAVKVLPGGGFSAHATLVTKCAPRFGDELTESVSLRNARLSQAGRYGETTSFSDELEPGVPLVGRLHTEGTIRFGVRVLAGGLARGDVRVQSTYSDPDTGREVSRCDTGRIFWTARRPAPGAGLGRPALQPGIHRGTTGRGEPFLMRVIRGGRFVARAGMTVQVGCPSGIGLPLDVVAHRLRVRRGRFGAADGFRRGFTYPSGERVVEHYSWQLQGRFGASGVRGTFNMHGVVRSRSGERVGSCDTGTIAWRASR